MSRNRPLRNKSSLTSSFTKIIPISGNQIKLNKPVLVAGFPDRGLVGTVSINHMIEQLHMHQIAFVESQFIMPAAIFIGKKFRHPFRLYSNDAGTVCAMLCEVPIYIRASLSIIDAVIEWGICSNVSEVVVLGGINPNDFSPKDLLERKALLLQTGSDIQSGAEGIDYYKEKSEGYREESGGMSIPHTALIPGAPGLMLSSCAARGIKCTGLMVPSIIDGPDPEGAAIILEAAGRLVPRLKVDTTSLRDKGEIIKKHLEEFFKMHQQHMRQFEHQDRGHADAGQIYK